MSALSLYNVHYISYTVYIYIHCCLLKIKTAADSGRH